jgi:hypothetical protein
VSAGPVSFCSVEITVLLAAWMVQDAWQGRQGGPRPSRSNFALMLAMSSMDEVSSHRPLKKLKLYQTKAKFYLVGSTLDQQHFRICKFSRLEVLMKGEICMQSCGIILFEC